MADVEPASELAGDYTRRHRVWVFHGNEPLETEVTDRLTLEAVDVASLDFQLKVFAVSGQECRLRGEATRRREFFASVKSTASGLCELRFQVDGDLILVTDVESRCSAAECSESVTIDRRPFAPVKAEG